ncbi:amidohydrolase family protein [Jiangella anatolica]|uniref:Amidohydrolase-related domain-containing protein n=1 Tax=Jiangella anatolica TaxID=2670374 RepID=A0A2W2B204_9ACTN|nr:amidohydrolase family protein [Jiangella anatolica]PZF80022.1 hypothetical protein C1I92_28190 [Jiangella anatolica]
MLVFDAHRLLGPIPSDDVTTTDLDGLVAELDHLAIDACAVSCTAEIFGDPRSEHTRETVAAWLAAEAAPTRHLTAQVIIPAGTSGWPSTPEDILGAAPALVRACPVRHHFDPLGPVARSWWRELAAHDIPVALDAGECGLPLISALAATHPRLRILVLSAGYRELRRLAELLETFPGVYIETGTLVAAGAVEWLAREYGPDRLVFGTGAPLWDDAGPRFLLDHLELPEPDVEMVAAGSARELIGERWPW